MTQRAKRLGFVLSVVGILLVFDQTTKYLVNRTIAPGSVQAHQHENEFFYVTHERNPGLIGGAFHDRQWIVMGAPVLAAGVLLYLFGRLDAASRAQSLAYGLVAGGAVGNMTDRFVRGEVIDFLQFHFYFIPFDFPWKRYPAFNIADIGVCVGVLVLLVIWDTSYRPAKEPSNVPNPS